MRTGPAEPTEDGPEQEGQAREDRVRGDGMGAESSTNTPPPQASSGSLAIGVMTGGAVAAGERARAEDRALRLGQPPPPALLSEGVSAPPGGVGIGVMTGGAAASGPGSEAVDTSTHLIAVSPELRTALAALHEQLTVLAPTAETEELGAQLDEAEAEIAATGQVSRGRLQWLRERLDLGATAAAGLASAASVVQAIGQLLGQG